MVTDKRIAVYTKNLLDTTYIRIHGDTYMAQVVLSREERGRLIAEKPNQIVRLDERFYRVASQSRDMMYDVTKKRDGSGWLCTCPDFQNRHVVCKHIWACQISQAVRHEVEARVIEPVTFDACIYCRSPNLMKWGIRHNKYGDIQKFACKSCGKYFTVNLGFEKMKHDPKAITTAMQLYFSGESLRNVARSLRLLGTQVSYQTIYRWIEKYTALMTKYLDKITPQVSDTWATDELFLKAKGNMKYLYAMMDEQTRFWIAQEVADTKYTADVRPLFQLAKAVAGKTPKTLVSDGAANFHEAYLKEFYTTKLETRPGHIRHIRLAGDFNNNKMERMNGEIRDRERNRGLLRSSNNVTSDYGEYVAARKMRLDLMRNSTKGYDAVDKNHVRYQIKSRRITRYNKSKQLGVIRDINSNPFRFLIAVVFDEDFSLKNIWKIPLRVVKKYSKFSKHQNGHILILEEKVLRERSVQRVA